MNEQLITEKLGDLVHQCTPDNFKKGYDPITDIIDDYESRSGEDLFTQIAIEKYCENPNRVLRDDECFDIIECVNENDWDVNFLYVIDFYGNIFFYRKSTDLKFRQSYKNWDQSYFGDYNWYYYWLDIHIMESLEDEDDFEEYYAKMVEDNFIPFVEDEPNDLNDFWRDYED